MKSKIIDLSFTIFLLCLIFWLVLESKLFFTLKAKSFNEVLQSDFANYKIKHIEENPKSEAYDISNSANFMGYEKIPKKNIKTVANINQEPEPEEITSYNFSEEINYNPLLKGYYAQLGIFTNKETAEESIKLLSLKGILGENFTSYIETKNIKSKVLYLVEIGVFSTKEDAINFCNKLKKLQIGCLVIN